MDCLRDRYYQRTTNPSIEVQVDDMIELYSSHLVIIQLECEDYLAHKPWKEEGQNKDTSRKDEMKSGLAGN